MPAFKDLTGQIFKDVLVNKRAPNRRLSQRTTLVMWDCTCLLCGKDFTARASNLRSGNTTSCGCTNKECVSKAQLEDLTGQIFGRLFVLERAPDYIQANGRHRTMWKCLCECGNIINVRAEQLTSGKTKSCGCYALDYRSKRYTHDLTGMRFGHLTVLRRVSPPGKTVIWECQCDCGAIKNVHATALRSGLTQSCGCKMFSIGSEKVALTLKENNIRYKPEYKFKDLYTGNKHYLRFDFGLLDDKRNLIALIEYQGQQHFMERIDSDFGRRQREVTDPMKKEYCKKNNILLFEVRYDEDPVEKTNEILIQLNLKQANPVPSSVA